MKEEKDIMIRVTQKKKIVDEYFIDKDSGETLVRAYADFHGFGWLCGVNITPSWVPHSRILNVDIALCTVPRFLARRIDFDYSPFKRRAIRRGGLGKMQHIHLNCTHDQLNDLIRLVGTFVRLDGDEIAVRTNQGSWFWVDEQALDWIQLEDNHPLRDEAAAILKSEPWGTMQCHSVRLHSIHGALVERCVGSQMGGHFAAASTAVSGFGQKVAEGAMKKAREAAEKQKQPTAEDGQKQRQQTTSGKK